MKVLLEKLMSYFKIRYAILLIPVCGFAIYDSVFQSFSSILGVLKDNYPDIPITVIQMIIALPPMISIPGTLLTGFLAAYITKKRLAEFAMLVIFIGGMIPVVFPDPTIEMMFACSGLIGLGQGLLHPLANSIICARWTDDVERSKVLGFKQCFNYIGEIAVTMCIGFLALFRWGNAFLVYLGVIPIFILTMIYLPKGEPEKKIIDKEHKAQGLKEFLRPRVIYLFAIFCIAMMCLYGYYTNIAMLVQERGFGNTADIAVIQSVISGASLVIGVLYGVITKKLGRFTLATGYAILAVGMFVVAFSVNLPMIFVGAIIIGFGVGVQQISTIYYISMTVSSRFVTLAVSIALCCVSLGASLAPIVINAISSVTVGSYTPMSGLVISGIGYCCLMATEFFVSIFRKHTNDDHGSGMDDPEVQKALDMSPEI